MLRTLYKKALKLNSAKTQTRTVNKAIKEEIQTEKNVKKINIEKGNIQTTNKSCNKNTNKNW